MKPLRHLFFIVFSVFFLGLGQIPAQALEAAAAIFSTQPVSLDYTNANLPTVLKAIAYSYDLNIVISKNITGKVTAQLKNVSLDEALNAILGVNGYIYYRKDNIVYIMPKADQEQVTESIPLSYLSAKEAKQLASKTISASGDIQENEATNCLVVKDYPQVVDRVRKLIRDIDIQPVQVLIEARIVDLRIKDSSEIGASIMSKYGDGKTTLNGNVGSAVASSTTASTPLTFTQQFADGGVFGAGGVWNHITAAMAINALVSKNKARILASPSIATLNGKEARIIIGERYPYQQSASVTGSTTTSNTQFVDVGTMLRVTPMVSPDGWITMKVHPEVSALIQMTSAGPQIATREADAEVRVKDNETIVIGGLISRDDERSKDGVPGLSAIPFFGWLFQKHTTQNDNGELTVFITPHIIHSSQEAALANTDGKPEVYVDAKSGQDQDILAGLLAQVEYLERDDSLPRDLYRSSELLRVYKTILQQFPQSGKTDLCLYKIAQIYSKEFGKCDAARAALTRLKDEAPDSPYVARTNTIVNACLDAALKVFKKTDY
ncbi:MAG: secretin and TonB N-terminal domain-containing protein [Candidatus Omnitrophica bacterium]|nr:secretin and TonB N-terminal domain-containing protein [Candidatus Omnitrophota bacterium]